MMDDMHLVNNCNTLQTRFAKYHNTRYIAKQRYVLPIKAQQFDK